MNYKDNDMDIKVFVLTQCKTHFAFHKWASCSVREMAWLYAMHVYVDDYIT